MQLLIVEDEAPLMDSMVSYLGMEGFKCVQAVNYREGLCYMDQHDYICMLIDLNLPDGDGLELVKMVRKNQGNAGIIIISARGDLEQRIRGLESGADDYLVKPFHLSELVARVQSVIRRTRTQGEEILEMGVIRVLPEKKQCFVNEKSVELTRKELDLLMYLMANRNRVITKEGIADFLWGDYGGGYGSYDFVYTHLKNLRRKLIKAGSPDYLHNIYGVGYKFSQE